MHVQSIKDKKLKATLKKKSENSRSAAYKVRACHTPLCAVNAQPGVRFGAVQAQHAEPHRQRVCCPCSAPLASVQPLFSCRTLLCAPKSLVVPRLLANWAPGWPLHLGAAGHTSGAPRHASFSRLLCDATTHPQAVRSEILLPEDSGFLEAEGLERTYHFRQKDIKQAVDRQSARKVRHPIHHIIRQQQLASQSSLLGYCTHYFKPCTPNKAPAPAPALPPKPPAAPLLLRGVNPPARPNASVRVYACRTL